MAKRYLDGSLRSARRIFGVHVGGHTNAHAKCVGKALSGKAPGKGGLETVRKNFTEATKSCP